MKNLIKKILALLIGLTFSFLLLEILLNVVGLYQKGYFQTTDKSKMVILALGDSMTVVGGNDSYPTQLQKILRSNKSVQVVNGGISGASSSVILENLESNIQKYHPRIVLLMSGINDFRNRYDLSIDSIGDFNSDNNFKSVKLFKYLYSNIDNSIRKKLSRLFIWAKNYDLAIDIYQYKDFKDFDYFNKISLSELKNKKYTSSTYLQLGKHFLSLSRYDLATYCLTKNISDKNSLKKNRSYELLYEIAKIQDDKEKMSLYVKKIIENSMSTFSNYQKAINLLEKNNIVPIIIQYPLRDKSLYEILLNGNFHTVENKNEFESAIAKYGTGKIFIDYFAGDFGHCTSLGNKIIAENVAKVILDNNLISSPQSHLVSP